MPFCPNCGSQIDGSDKFCRQCGQTLDSSSKEKTPKEKSSGKGLLESRSLRYFPDDEESILRKMTLFGWKLKSRNEIFDRTSVVDSAFTYGYKNFASTHINTHTEITCYVSALFERDPKNVPEYKRIVQLEKEFDETEEKIVGYYSLLSDLDKKIKHPGHDFIGIMAAYIITGGFALVFAILALFMQSLRDAFTAFLIISGISFSAFCALIFLYFVKSHKNRETALERKKKALPFLKKHEEHQKAVIRKAKSLMS